MFFSDNYSAFSSGGESILWNPWTVITSFISPSSLIPFTHSKIIRVIYEVNTMYNRINFLVIFPLSYVFYPPMHVVFREGYVYMYIYIYVYPSLIGKDGKCIS